MAESQFETDPQWVNRDSDWSNRAADRVVEELILTQLLSPDAGALARGLVSRELLYLLRSGVRPMGPP
jgi:hypothetical protein